MTTAREGTQRTDVDKAFLDNATYRSLGEQELSEREERFEKARRTSGLVIAPLVTIVMLLLPTGLDQAQHRLAAVLLGVVVLWITEAVPIPIGGFIGIAAIVMIGVVPVDDALAPFGSSTVFTFIGAFILAQAMLKHGLAKRFAMFVLSIRGVGKSTTRVIIAFGAITCLLSAFVSNTATVAMLLPTAIGLLTVIAKLMQSKEVVPGDFDPLRLRVGVAIMLMLAYGASVGGLLTPVGSPPNLIGRGLIEEATGETITFLDWMLLALPICALMFVALAIVILLLNKPELRKLEGVEEWVAAEKAELGRFSTAERNTLIAFGITVTLWITPGVVALVAGAESSAYETVSGRLDEGIVAVLGASLLFLLPTDWPQARVHPALGRRREDRLGNRRPLRHRHRVRLAAGVDRPGRDDRQRRVREARARQHLRHHGVRHPARDPRVRDDQQHRLGGCRRTDHHPDRHGRRHQPVRARPRRDVRCQLRLHAAGLDATERHRLRVGRRTDHEDDPHRRVVRRDRRDPDPDLPAGRWSACSGSAADA